MLRKNAIPFHNPYREANGFWNPLKLGHQDCRSPTHFFVAGTSPVRQWATRAWNFGDLQLLDRMATIENAVLKAGVQTILAGTDRRQTVTLEELSEFFTTEDARIPSRHFRWELATAYGVVARWPRIGGPSARTVSGGCLRLNMARRNWCREPEHRRGHGPFRQRRRGRCRLSVSRPEPGRILAIRAPWPRTRFRWCGCFMSAQRARGKCCTSPSVSLLRRYASSSTGYLNDDAH